MSTTRQNIYNMGTSPSTGEISGNVHNYKYGKLTNKLQAFCLLQFFFISSFFSVYIYIVMYIDERTFFDSLKERRSLYGARLMNNSFCAFRSIKNRLKFTHNTLVFGKWWFVRSTDNQFCLAFYRDIARA